MPTLNPAHLPAALAMIQASPLLEALDVEVLEIGEGFYRARVEITRKHTNAFGGVNGGVYAALLDAATYWCLYCSMPEDVGYTTVDLSVSDVRACTGGIVYSEGKVIRQGRTISLTEGRLTDEEGRLLAHATSKLFASPTIQPVSAAVDYLGLDPMPPKFLD